MRWAATLLALALATLVTAQQKAGSGSRMEVAPPQALSPPVVSRRVAADIEVAYRAFAAGDLDSAERMFSELIDQQPSPAAYLLRGCTRYTRAMLLPNPGSLSEGARSDIRRAYALNPSLSLDPRLFSPRLIAFLNEVRQ